MTTDRDRDEMRELCRQFRDAMARENDVLLFDQDARERIGNMIGRAVRQGGSQFAYTARG